MPPLDLLAEENVAALEEDEIKRKAALIEETLRQFGLVGKVIEVSPGPAVTRFGLEPGYIERPGPDGTVRRQKVRVEQIASLHNDLSLALAASPLCIEAPVPGKSIVGIEVPNEGRSIVSLRGILESPSFRKLAGKPLAVALGRDVAGGAVSADLATMPHLLIAGTTGSGKSVCINAIITCLVMSNQPEDLKLVMIDPKMVELVRWNGLPHLLGKVETDLDRTVGVLRWVTREMDSRYKKCAEAGSRNLADYNEKRVERGEDKMPYLVVLIDGLTDFTMALPEVENTIYHLGQRAHTVGIHLVVTVSQWPVDMVNNLIESGFLTRICFVVTSPKDSSVILGRPGAEALLRGGDMLYLAPYTTYPIRLQGCFVSDKEILNLTRYWKGTRGLWEKMRAQVEQAKEPQEDDLLEHAIEVVRLERRASISLLQRKLQIGYTRAARLIDLMEQKGVVSPAEEGARWREVLVVPSSGMPDTGDEEF